MENSPKPTENIGYICIMPQQNTIAKLYICYTAIFTYTKIIRKIGCKPRSPRT